MKIKENLFLSLVIFAGIFGCDQTPGKKNDSQKMTKPTVTSSDFGKTPDGQSVSLFTLTNSNGSIAKITNYGACLVSLQVPDKHGNLGEVILGFDDLEGYIEDKSYQGAIVGRYGNRIANGEFSLDGETYSLAKNNGTNHLHGGVKGFNKVVWEAYPSINEKGSELRLIYQSLDGEEGYPGELICEVTYTFYNKNVLGIVYRATTDKTTIVNLTHHSYFNLKDGGVSSILDHQLKIFSDSITPVNKTLIPTGELMPVAGTPFDFNIAHAIGDQIDADHIQIKYGGGYDHNWVIRKQPGLFHQAAHVYEPVSGRRMEVVTTEPGIQFYAGNFLDGSMKGRGGVAYQKRSGFCLETQHYPDSPNQPHFPSTVLNPGERYRTATLYKFSVLEK